MERRARSRDRPDGGRRWDTGRVGWHPPPLRRRPPPAPSARRRRRQAGRETATRRDDRAGSADPPRPRRRLPRHRRPPRDGTSPTLRFGAYQRGFYLTAFSIATRRVEEKGDVKAMTLLGELYANGFGVGRDDKKADRLVPARRARGDREAMFALADVPPHRARRRRSTARRPPSCSPPPPSSGTSPPPTISACSISKARLFPQDFTRAAELFRGAAQAGNPEAQYALATLYKDGRGVTKDVNEAARLLAAAAAAAQRRRRRSNMRSRCSTAAASPRTRPRPRRC